MKKGIYIPEPCHEDWDKMTPKDKGRFCQSCAKIVVDFINMNKDEIIDHIENAAGKTCGQFNQSQLDHAPTPEIVAPINEKYNFSRYAAAGLIGVSMLSATVTEAQQNRPFRGMIAYHPVEVKENVKQTATTIEGIVTDSHTNKAISSVQVSLMSAGRILFNTTTDTEGKYTFNVPGGNIQDNLITLGAVHPDYKSKKIENIPVNKDTIHTNIDLGYGIMMLGMPVLMKEDPEPEPIKENEEINGEMNSVKEKHPEKITPQCKLSGDEKTKENEPPLTIDYATLGTVAIVEHPVTPEKNDTTKVVEPEYPEPECKLPDEAAYNKEVRKELEQETTTPVTKENIVPAKEQLITKLYPNPSSDRAVLELSEKGKYSIEMHDALGRKVFSTAFKGDRLVLQLEKYNPGVYFINITSKGTELKESIQLVID